MIHPGDVLPITHYFSRVTLENQLVMFLIEDADYYNGYVRMTREFESHKVRPPLLVGLFFSSVEYS